MVIQQQVSGSLKDELVTRYFKKSGITVFVQRTEHDLLLTDKLCIVRVPSYAKVSPFKDFPEDWRKAAFAPKSEPILDGPEQEDAWNAWEKLEVESVLTISHELVEVPGSDKDKPGTFYRKLLAGERAYYYSKAMLDMFSPDLYTLDGFLFERMAGYGGIMRVSAKYGHVAFVMPGRNIATR